MRINQTVLMSGAEYMTNAQPINALMRDGEPFNREEAIREHAAIRTALEAAGVKVFTTPAPPGCQDGIFTANWALVRGDQAVMARLPNVRQPEEAYARDILASLGKKILMLPEGLKSSGAGDALPCGDYLFMGSGYRTDVAVHQMVSDMLGYNVISLQAIPKLDAKGVPVINKVTGLPDSDFYDLDLAVSVLYPPSSDAKGLIAYCPEALTPESQAIMRGLDFVDKIEVPLHEAVSVSACNLVSTGEHVVMNAGAPVLQAGIESYGLTITTLRNQELAKNGGSVRCSTLTLDNA